MLLIDDVRVEMS